MAATAVGYKKGTFFKTLFCFQCTKCTVKSVHLYYAVVLDWWMFTKTDIFGILIKKKTGRMPDVMRVDPQWDGKEFLKLFLEVIISVVLAWIFIKVR